MVLVTFQICWQQNQLQGHSPKASTKTSKTPQPKPLPKGRTRLEEGKEHPPQSLVGESAFPARKKAGTCGFKPVANPRPATHPGSEAALESLKRDTIVLCSRRTPPCPRGHLCHLPEHCSWQ